MKVIKRACLLSLLLGTILLLSACMPPSYTKEDKENMTKQYEPEVLEWFANNLPEATVKNTSIYSDGSDLAYAMTGTVKYNKETVDFVYNLETKTMYLPFGYYDAIDILASEISNVLNIPSDKFTIVDSYFCFYTQNPFPGERNVETSFVEFDRLKPFDVSVEQFAEDIISGQTYTAFHVYVYDGEILEYDAEVFNKLPNLVSVEYSIPLDWDFDDAANENFYSYRLASASYTDLYAEYFYLGLERTDEDIITGYVQCIKNKGEEIPDPNSDKESSVTRSDGVILINTPKQAIPVVFTANKKKMKCSYGKTEEELSLLDKNARKDAVWGKGVGFAGYDNFFGLSAGRIILPKSKYNCYELFTISEPVTTEFKISY